MEEFIAFLDVERTISGWPSYKSQENSLFYCYI